MTETGEPIGVEARPMGPNVYELRLEGSLDWSNFDKVEAAIQGIFDKKVFNIVVNLAGVKYISSSGFGCFIQSLDTALNNGGKMIFSSTPDSIREVFDILGLDKVVTFAASEQEALKQF